MYAGLDDGLTALEDDIRGCCDLYRAAAKRTGSDFAGHLANVSAVACFTATFVCSFASVEAQTERKGLNGCELLERQAECGCTVSACN